MANIQIRIDDKLKEQANLLLQDLGMDFSTFIRIALKQAIEMQGIPFEIKRHNPNEETIQAIQEVEQMKKNPSMGKSYRDVDEMMNELLS